MSELGILREIAGLKRQLDLLTAHGNVGADGWMPACEVWTRTGATTFTLSGQADRTAIYQPGTKLRCKQGGGWLYFYVVSSTYAAPTTTVTVTGGSDYSLAAATITDNYYSYASLPQGFPAWHNYTVTWACTAGGNPAIGNGTLAAKFRMLGKTIEVLIYVQWGNTTTNGGGIYTWTIPIGSLNAVLNRMLRGEMNLFRSGVDSFTALPQPMSATTIAAKFMNDGTYVSFNNPYAWTTNDAFSIDFCYPLI